MTPDWDSIKIRCSSLGCLFTEPKSKEDKDKGELSATAKEHLIKVYAMELWGVEKDIVTKQMKKGTEAEQEGLTLLSIVDGDIYVKNNERFENEYISGHPDIILEEIVDDTKLSWDAFTFLEQLTKPVDKNYKFQIHGYMSLLNKKHGRIRYCLVDTPDNIIEGEKYRLLRSMDVISEESPEYLEAARKLESNMRFGHIPPTHRVITHEVPRDQSIIDQIPQKVIKAREYLKYIHKLHIK